MLQLLIQKWAKTRKNAGDMCRTQQGAKVLGTNGAISRSFNSGSSEHPLTIPWFLDQSSIVYQV
ncbi:hypothetical protein FRX31_032673 [Thalictrum thalictroides]|uniref:Uncharacterized protein n=1 Tax=Thalictrum thalictroides TaxID=46969 RepID=A0A7J6UYN6_THATH|nr:hypothetical protein FRX31_032673 [Thalictrum thalictroides]